MMFNNLHAHKDQLPGNAITVMGPQQKEYDQQAYAPYPVAATNWQNSYGDNFGDFVMRLN